MKVIGIDLGTTNTVAAIDGKVFELDRQSGSLLPSVVAFPPNGIRVVGTAARRRRPIDPHNTLFSTKRLIGRKWYATEVGEFKRRYDFELVEGEASVPQFVTRTGPFSPTDVATMVLERVYQFSPFDFGDAIGVVTVPSMFGQAERDATREAAEMAGLTEVRIVDEPTAVAMAHLSMSAEQIGRAAVYDFGGGTFDLAVVDCGVAGMEVMASGGDLYLGGDDIDQGLAGWVADVVMEEHHWDLRADRSTYARLVAECELAKIRLSRDSQTAIDLTRVDPVSPLASAEVQVDRKRVTRLASDLVYRTFVICDEVLARAGVKASELDALFVAGGAIQQPTLSQAVEEYFGKPVMMPFNPMHVVAIGASIAGTLGQT